MLSYSISISISYSRLQLPTKDNVGHAYQVGALWGYRPTFFP